MVKSLGEFITAYPRPNFYFAGTEAKICVDATHTNTSFWLRQNFTKQTSVELKCKKALAQ